MDITATIITSFRLAYPLFSDFTSWPDNELNKSLCEGDEETGSVRWREYLDDCHNLKQRGMFLFAAHLLVTNYPSGAAFPNTQSIMPKNQVASKSTGDESISYTTAPLTSINQAGDAWLASTSFGQQFIRLRRRTGMGALAV